LAVDVDPEFVVQSRLEDSVSESSFELFAIFSVRRQKAVYMSQPVSSWPGPDDLGRFTGRSYNPLFRRYLQTLFVENDVYGGVEVVRCAYELQVGFQSFRCVEAVVGEYQAAWGHAVVCGL